MNIDDIKKSTAKMIRPEKRKALIQRLFGSEKPYTKKQMENPYYGLSESTKQRIENINQRWKIANEHFEKMTRISRNR